MRGEFLGEFLEVAEHYPELVRDASDARQLKIRRNRLPEKVLSAITKKTLVRRTSGFKPGMRAIRTYFTVPQSVATVSAVLSGDRHSRRFVNVMALVKGTALVLSEQPD
jgi:hypothetical protein